LPHAPFQTPTSARAIAPANTDAETSSSGAGVAVAAIGAALLFVGGVAWVKKDKVGKAVVWFKRGNAGKIAPSKRQNPHTQRRVTHHDNKLVVKIRADTNSNDEREDAAQKDVVEYSLDARFKLSCFSEGEYREKRDKMIQCGLNNIW
jgi:hypothetical protein